MKTQLGIRRSPEVAELLLGKGVDLEVGRSFWRRGRQASASWWGTGEAVEINFWISEQKGNHNVCEHAVSKLQQALPESVFAQLSTT